MNKRTTGLSWLLVLALFLGAADDGLAGKKKKKGKKKKAEESEQTGSGDSSRGLSPPAEAAPPAPPPPVVQDIDKRLLAYDTEAARSRLSGQAIGSDVNLQIAEGRVLAQEGNVSQAVDRLSRAADAAPNDPAPLVHLGEAHARAGNNGAARDAYSKAEKRAQAILDGSPDHTATLYHLGLAQQGLGNYDQAIRTLEKARAKSSRDARIVYQIGATQAFQNNWAAALDTLTKAIDMDSGIAYAYYYRGLAANGVGQKSLMVNDFDRFLFMAPNAPEADQVSRLLGGL